MSVIPASVKCNGCGKFRHDDTNHWRSMKLFDEIGVAVQEGITDNYEFHTCGDGCASKMFARWLSTGKLTE